MESSYNLYIINRKTGTGRKGKSLTLVQKEQNMDYETGVSR